MLTADSFVAQFGKDANGALNPKYTDQLARLGTPFMRSMIPGWPYYRPAFLSASIYLCLSRKIVIYGQIVSRVRPAIYTITFISFDLFSVVLLAVGGAIAASTDDRSPQQACVNIMVAVLAFQVFSLFFFMSLCANFDYSAYRKQSSLDPAHATVRNSTKIKAFQLALFAAIIFIFVRSCFRMAKVKQGFDGKLVKQEVTFMVLEGAIIILAVTSLTFFHPGTCFQGIWYQANFSIQASKDRTRAQNIESHEGTIMARDLWQPLRRRLDLLRD